jgi:hypothetical protein
MKQFTPLLCLTGLAYLTSAVTTRLPAEALVLSCRSSCCSWPRWGRPGSASPATAITANFCNLALARGHWSQWRGPNGSGVFGETGLPAERSPESARWKTALPGHGHSSPIVWGNRVLLTAELQAPVMKAFQSSGSWARSALSRRIFLGNTDGLS